MASIGINGIIVNNVNANASILSTENIEGLGRIADTFRPYGVKVGIALNFASPTAGLVYGNLSTFDPLNAGVIEWWQNVTDTLYDRVPDMAGYLVKANSEGQPGPLTYNRTLAEGANLFANALAPHGGTLVFRAFVYDSVHLNESIWTDDRANAAVQFFTGLDGEYFILCQGMDDFSVTKMPPRTVVSHNGIPESITFGTGNQLASVV